MLNLDTKLTLDAKALESPNLCDRFDKRDLDAIGNWVHEGYTRDLFSRSRWEKRMESALDLAVQVQKDKNFPWPGCSNVAFPLVTIAALQFHARAYPAIITGTHPVNCRVIGEDPQGLKTSRAKRVGDYMSWQVTEEDAAWEEQQDRLLITLPIMGCVFKKSRFDGARRHPVGEMVSAFDLVLDYWAPSVETAARKTQRIPRYRNELHELIMRGKFRDVREESWYDQAPQPRVDPARARQDTRTGLTIPQTDEETPFLTLEQHVSLDLDGDGYAEPYIITIEESSKCVLAIATRFDREEDIERNARKEIISIRAREYFTKYSFIPSPDGGIYDLGFGVLLGPLNESVNSLINQLIDAGTMSVAAGGFLGRGAKIRGGVYTFAPFQWQRVDSSGDDLRKNLFPLPVREPSMVLFQLLGLLITYVNRISGATDTMVGENPGQNTPASNMQAMVEQGMKIYNAIFKRVWRGMKEEFKKLYILNSIYLPIRKPFGTASGFILREDFLGNPDAIAPSADPNVASETELIQRAVMLKQSAATTPGYNRDAVERRFLAAMKIDAIEQIFPGTEGQAPPESEKITLKKMDLQFESMKLQEERQRFAAELMEEQRLNTAQIAVEIGKLQVAIMTAEGDEKDRQIAAINASIGIAKQRDAALKTRIETLLKPAEMAMASRKLDIESRKVEKANERSPAE